jgi:hypothetical protein
MMTQKEWKFSSRATAPAMGRLWHVPEIDAGVPLDLQQFAQETGVQTLIGGANADWKGVVQWAVRSARA